MVTWGYVRRSGQALLREVSADGAIYAGIAIYCALAVVFLAWRGGADFASLLDSGLNYARLWGMVFVLVFPMLVVAAIPARVMLRLEPPLRQRGYRAILAPLQIGRFAAGTLVTLGFVPFWSLFTTVKNAIPRAEGFTFDVPLANLDRVLHGGVDPYHWLAVLGHHEWLQRLIEINYNTLWFIVCFGAFYVILVSRRADRVRTRFALCFILVWAIVGSLAATLVPSAGPAFYAAVTGDSSRFAELIEYTSTTSGQFGSASDIQAYLWGLHVSGQPGLGSGISAFPSMHVALLTLCALFVAELNRRWLIPALVYVLFTLASSVYLGWHYAVDGYASVLLTAGIYWAARTLPALRWPHLAPVPKPAPATS